MHNLGRNPTMYETLPNEQFEQFEYPGETGEANYEALPGEGVFQETPLHEIFHEAGVYEAPHGESAFETFETMPELFESNPEVFGETYSGELTGEGLSPEMIHEELAQEFAGIQSEAEIDRFIGKALRRVVRGAGRFIRSPAGRVLTGVLRQAAKRALPLLGRAVGTYFGGPLGGQLGSQLASFAGRQLGLELEGLAAEDREMEVSRRFVSFAVDAIRNAARSPMAGRVARAAIVTAARKYYPGLVQAAGTMTMPGTFPGTLPVSGVPAGVPLPAGVRRPVRGVRGTWVRRGRAIILYGL